MPDTERDIPFEALPLDPTGPPGNAWGRFGPSDQLGTLNLLTPELIVSVARSEIKTGIRVSLDWPLSLPSFPSFDRDPFHQKMINRRLNTINDDILTFNTQGSSQWDGFRHYGYQKAMRFYNNATQQDLETSDLLGIHVVAENGGITGRGVLIDYYAWTQKQGVAVNAFESCAITLDDVKKVMQDCQIQLQKGDILFIRSGFTAAYNKLSEDERRSLAQRPSPDFIGLESSRTVLKWMWEQQFAAVAGDAPSFERAPVRGSHMDPEHHFHEWVLSGWGTPIGELFDLERLGEHCARTGRYTFFISSVPLKVIGGVASPPNAVAIF